MVNPSRINRKRSAGFGLVEVMVALVIGMFGVLVMVQVMSVSEEQKRTTTSGNDAMNEGVLALYGLQTDLRMAGYGVADNHLLSCKLQLSGTVTLDNLAPVVINPVKITGNDPNTDTLLVFYGSTMGSTQGDNVITTSTVQTPASFAKNDYVVQTVPTPATPCAANLLLDQINGDLSGAKATLLSGGNLVSGNVVFNLGQTYRAVGYAIRGGNLTMCEFSDPGKNCSSNTAANWTAIANNVVSLRALYGRDTSVGAMDGIVDVYDHTTPTSACAWIRTPAVSLALVARSIQMEKTDVTSAVPTWDGSTTAAFDLSGNADWKKYRYKVFQTVVPLRNVSWMGVVTGC